MSTLNHIELFEKYLAGTLHGNEPAEFEKKFREDSEFAEDFLAFKKLLKGLQRNGLKQQLAGYETEIRKEQKSRFRLFTTTRILRIAAVLVLVAGTSTFLYENFKTSVSEPQNPQELYAEYFSPYKNLAGLRGGDTHVFSRGMIAYSSGDYASALYHLKKVSKEDSVYKDALLYSGICYLALEKSNEAIQLFQELKKSDAVYTQQVNWYTALAYLQSERLKDAKALLHKIKSGDFNYEESRKLLRELNELDK